MLLSLSTLISAKKPPPVAQVLAEVAVAATKNSLHAAMLAGCASLPTFVLADTVPERAQISFKYLDYQDSQPGLKRISVKAPSTLLMLPIADEWVVETGLIVDTISGASPSYHSEKSSAAKMNDERTGRDFRVTKYLPYGTLTVSKSYSSERDYVSNAQSISGTVSSDDKNTTLNFGIGQTDDRIDVPFLGVNNQRKQATDVMLGVTQILTPIDIVQLNLTRSDGHGFYSDPYKQGELEFGRPRHKAGTAILGRWNHHFVDSNTTLRLSYRYYEDSFDIRSHTVGGEWVIPTANDWIITPALRYYTQTAAFFYADPQNAPLPTFNLSNQPYFSQDQRLSAFGGRTIGLKVARKLGKDWLIDVKYEDYEQRSALALSGNGSPGIDTFRARIWQFGLTHFF